jgi:uncharacterized protein YqeY
MLIYERYNNNMDKEKQERLEAAGWKVGIAKDFLSLTDEECKKIDSLQTALRHDIKISIRQRDSASTEALKVILGELQRSPTKEISHDEEIKILKKLEKNEEDMLDHAGIDEPSLYLKLVRMYLPQMADQSELEWWIKERIDFSTLKNPMQAVGIVMKEFGARADGRIVKDIVMRISETKK